MKYKILHIVIFLSAVYMLALGQEVLADGDIVFRGTVTKIDNSPISDISSKDWVVHFRIDQVLSGTIASKFFSFRVHSPARSSLKVGTQYTVVATWADHGYSVDENQWMKALRPFDGGDEPEHY